MSDLESLKSELGIDLEGLHNDAKEQPHFACEAAELAAEAKAAAKRAKIILEESVAAAQARVRKNPESHGIEKVTEKAVEAAVCLDRDVMEKGRIVISEEEYAAKADAVSTAFDHRRSMLKLEVQLFLNNYWGDISVRERDMAGPATDAAERKVLEGTKRRRGTGE